MFTTYWHTIQSQICKVGHYYVMRDPTDSYNAGGTRPYNEKYPTVTYEPNRDSSRVAFELGSKPATPTLPLIKTRHMYGASQPYPLPTLPPLYERATEFFKKLALTEDHLPMRCARLIEMLMKAYERIRGGSSGRLSSGEPGETETSSTNDGRTRGQPGPSSRPPAFTSN
jgi:hypothetical protein